MARIILSGFERNSVAAGIEVNNSFGTPTVTTTNQRSGTYGLEISSLSSTVAKGVYWQLVTADSDGPFFYRVYLKIGTLPSAENRIISSGGSITAGTDNRWYITLDSGGLLRLYDEDGQIGSASIALTTGRYYCIEVRYDSTAADGSHVVRALLDFLEFAGSSTRTVPSGVFAFHIGGNIASEAQTTGAWYFDDIAVNNSSGSSQNSYAGEEELILLKPDNTGDNSAWTNTYTNIDEVTPDDATTIIESTTLDAIEDVNLEASPAAIATTDTITLVAVDHRFRADGAAEPGFVTRIKATASGTVEESAEMTPTNTAFRTNGMTAVLTPSIVIYDLPGASTTAWTKTELDTAQIGVRISTDATNNIEVTTMGLYVGHKPVPTIIFDSASNSGYQTAQSTYSWSHTCWSVNRYLFVSVSMLSVAGSSVTSITYNGVAMTFIGAQASAVGAVRVELWGLIAPASGSNTVAVTLSAALDSVASAISLNNVHQTSPTEGFNSATATNVGAADATVNVTTVADNDWVLDGVATDDTAITVGAGQTSRNNVTGALGSGANSTEGPKTPAGSVTMSWTNVAALATWSIAAVGIRDINASTLATGVKQLAALGVG